MLYTCDNKFFKFKHEAQTYATKNNTSFRLYYHDDIYDSIDWKVEPVEPIQYYYREQAKRIREQHDYVILAYSGGYDSTNILEVFYNNSIKLDKVVTIGAFSKDAHCYSDENHNGEIYFNVYPTIKRLNLDSVFQVIDYTKYFDYTNTYKDLSILQYGDEWSLNTSVWYSPHHWVWQDIDKLVVPEEYRHKKVAIIFGKDKATIFKENNRVGFKFNDRALASYGTLSTKPNISKIMFYWDPQYPNILLKQLHLLNNLKYSSIDSIYNLSNKLVFKSPKSTNGLLSLRDTYFLRYNKDNLAYKLYIAGLQKAGLFKQSYNKEVTTYSKLYDII